MVLFKYCKTPICFTLFLYIASQYQCVVFSQQRYSVQHFTSENGLPQNSIKSIAIDGDGFMWLATEDGLTRFDGRQFKIFENNITGAHTKRVIAVVPWVRNAGKRDRLNVARAQFSSDEISWISSGRPGQTANDLRAHNAKMDALRTPGKDIYYVNGLPERWQRSMLPENPTYISDSYAEGNFFLCDRFKVTRYLRWKKHYEVLNDAPERLNYFTLRGQLYYFDGKKSFIQISNGHRVTSQVKGDILKNRAFASRYQRVKIYWNNNSDQAFFFLNGDLFELVPGQDGSLSTRLLVAGFDLVQKSIDVIHYDRESRKVFLGSSTEGLFVLSLPQFETIRVSGADRPNIFYGQAPYDENSILTSTGIIAGKNPQTGKYIDRRLTEIEKLNTDDKRVIVKDRQGNFWTKSGNSLTRMNQRNQIVGEWKFENGVKDIIQRSEYEFLVGVYDVGIFKIDVRGASSEPTFIGGEPAKHITCMSIRNAHELWVGAIKGLYIVDLQSGHTSLVPGTSELHIKSIQPHDGGGFWMTVVNKGLMLIDGQKQIVTFPMDKRGFLASAHYAFSGNGFLWIPTNRGLFQIKIADLLWYAKRRRVEVAKGDTGSVENNGRLFYAYHDVHEGFNTNEFNGGCNSCGLQLANGYVSLPSIDGLVWFKPEAVSPNEPAGKLILDGLQVNGQQINPVGDTLLLSLNPENVKLHFSTAYFGNPGNLQISYSLVGEAAQAAVTKWQDIDSDDIVVQYSSLPSGTHEFTIRKQGGFGQHNIITKKLVIIVPQIWYESRWVHLLFVLAFVFVGFLIWRVRFRQVKMQNQLLELQVAARTDELRQTLLTLEASQSDLLQQFHLQSRLLTSLAHDLRSPLLAAGLVTSEVGRLIKNHDLTQAGLLNRQVEDAVGLIRQSLDELLTYIKVQVYSKEVKIEQVALADVIDKTFGVYEKAARINSNSFENNVPRDVRVPTNSQMLDIIIRNLADNANKFTENGTISAHWTEDNAFGSLTIQDTGRGLPPAMVEWFEQTGSTSIPEKFNGLGLVIVKELAPFAMIRLKLQSRKGATQVTLHFFNNEISNTVFV